MSPGDHWHCKAQLLVIKMQYHFNSKIAEKVGVEGAIMIDNIHYWLIKKFIN